MQGIKKINPAILILVLIALCTCSPGPISALTEDEQNTIDIVKKTTNSVVFVTNIQLVRDFFYQEEAVARGTGSGFVWDSSGHIVTNYHVIEEGDLFAVTLPNQEYRKARLVGIVREKDLAVLRVEGDLKGLIPLKIGSSTNLQVGQKVIAIGNPFGFDHTVTTGIVSALGRNIRGAGNVTIRDMIQTDASINPGNSGGPLLNSDGQLIGINTMIYSQTGASAGIGFAVPVDTIKRVVPQLIKYGKVIRPGLGISLLSEQYTRRYNIEGVVVLEVEPDGPADRAGIKGLGRDRYGQLYIRDVIIGIDDHKITSYDDLYNTLDNYRVGDRVTVTVERDGKKRKVQLTLIRLD
ncbi:MAG: trypsin-like peptidase domain-containing protein [Candidatus Aminicenantes bacterium]